MEKKRNKKVFRGQKDGERVIAVYHKHWFSFLRPGLYFFLMFLVSIVGLWYWTVLSLGVLLVFLALYLFAVSYICYHFLLWWRDVYILTDRRVIDFDQKSLFHRVVSEAELGNIQDTSYEINGFWHTMMNIGAVEILTASASKNIRFENVGNPHEIQEQIIRVKDGKEN